MLQQRDIIHVGPVSWNRWPYDPVDIGAVADNGHPVAVVSFGTCGTGGAVAERTARLLVELGYSVLVAAGGRKELLNIMPREPRVITCAFAPLQTVLPHADLIISHGGQLTVFEALQNEVPVVVMPFQPEQAHSGVCLERIGCGRRLVPPRPFLGDSKVYVDALKNMTDDEIKHIIISLVNDPRTEKQLARMKDVIGRYDGAENLAALLEAA